jgi:hypothetical protein
LQIPISVARYHLTGKVSQMAYDESEGLPPVRAFGSCEGRVVRLVKGNVIIPGQNTCEDFPLNAACEFEGDTVLRKLGAPSDPTFQPHRYFVSKGPMAPNSQPCDPEVFFTLQLFLMLKGQLSEALVNNLPDCPARRIGGN